VLYSNRDFSRKPAEIQPFGDDLRLMEPVY
jgi:hypothetical protein